LKLFWSAAFSDHKKDFLVDYDPKETLYRHVYRIVQVLTIFGGAFVVKMHTSLTKMSTAG
jgi:hypothetical protein